jgi:hypothetical protein
LVAVFDSTFPGANRDGANDNTESVPEWRSGIDDGGGQLAVGNCIATAPNCFDRFPEAVKRGNAGRLHSKVPQPESFPRSLRLQSVWDVSDLAVFFPPCREFLFSKSREDCSPGRGFESGDRNTVKTVVTLGMLS